MAKYISDNIWAKYSNIINDFIENDAGLQPFKWLRKSKLPGPWSEDNVENYIPEDLLGLFQYNHIRAWPIGVDTPSGALDTTSMVLYITKTLLDSKGFINKFDEWDLDIISDRFIVNGTVYKPSGTTQMSQAKDKALLYFIVLEVVDSTENTTLLEKYK